MRQRIETFPTELSLELEKSCDIRIARHHEFKFPAYGHENISFSGIAGFFKNHQIQLKLLLITLNNNNNYNNGLYFTDKKYISSVTKNNE